MQSRTEQLVEYIQKNCLWQFFSRAWDREENIKGVLDNTEALLIGADPKMETDADRCHTADARILVPALTSTFPWLSDMDMKEKHALLEGVRERMREIVITSSHNEELYVKNY